MRKNNVFRQKKKLDNIRRDEFYVREYTAVKAEILERIRIMNSQATNAVGTILTSWSMALVFTAVCYSQNLQQEYFNRFILENIRNVLYLIPIFFFLPLSTKSGENLRQLASLSAYLKVFYEFPLIQYGNNSWETFNALLSNISVDKGKQSRAMKRYNGEYSVLASLSLVMFLLSAILTSYMVITLKDEFTKYIGLIGIIAWLFIYGLIIIVMCYLIARIHSVSCAKVNLMDMSTRYLGGYIEVAWSKGLLSEEEYQVIYETLDPFCKVSDVDIIFKVKEKWNYNFAHYKERQLKKINKACYSEEWKDK